MFDAGWDAGLDDEQLAVVTHGEGPLVVLAGAGTGKTRVLTARVAHLLERGVAPERLLLLTFTRRAADDMLGRAARLAGRRHDAERLQGGTFHAVAQRLLATSGEVVGLARHASVLDPEDAADVMDLLRDEHGLAGTERRFPRAATLVDIYSRCVDTRRPLAEVLAVDFPWCHEHQPAIAELCRAYVAHKRARQQVDFGDLLLFWHAALVHPEVGPALAGRFDAVLVDEAQDVNAVQADIVRALRPDGRGLTLVGDDAQAIYGFRGADARHLHQLATAFPDVTVLRLERNFRSLQPVLDVANQVRADLDAGPGRTGGNPSADLDAGPGHTGGGNGAPGRGAIGSLVLRADRPGGRRPQLVRCHDAAGEARAVVDRILDAHQRGTALRDQAVLVRAAHHSDLIELELSARGVPYRKYGGLRFVEAAHVKDFVAAARLLDNPADDVAWFRLLRLHHGVGPARAKAVLGALAPRRGDGGDSAEAVAAAPASARVALAATFAALDAARQLPDPAAQLGALVELLGPLVADRYRDGAARLADLRRLHEAAAAHGDLHDWLAAVTLDPPASCGLPAGPPQLDDDFVVLSTVHSAKGLEWAAVHLPHLVDGAFPSDMAVGSTAGLAEERRLFYVAVTRARDQLTLYTPLRMPHRRHAGDDRHSLAPASRFLDAELMALVEVQHPPPRPPAEPAALPGGPVAVDLDHLWR